MSFHPFLLILALAGLWWFLSASKDGFERIRVRMQRISDEISRYHASVEALVSDLSTPEAVVDFVSGLTHEVGNGRLAVMVTERLSGPCPALSELLPIESLTPMQRSNLEDAVDSALKSSIFSHPRPGLFFDAISLNPDKMIQYVAAVRLR